MPHGLALSVLRLALPCAALAGLPKGALAVKQRLLNEAERRAVYKTDSDSEVSTEDMMQMLSALQDSLLENSSGFQENIDASIGEMQALVSNFSQRTRELDVGLVRLSRGISAQDFVPLLANYFNLTLSSQVAHDNEVTKIYNRMETSMPEKLRVAVQPVVGMFLASDAASAPFDHATFKATPQEELCSKTAPIIDYMLSYHVNLTKVDGLLNTTVRILPILNMATPEAPQEVATFLENMVELGYRETTARERSYRNLQELVAPVVSEKLGCDFTSSDSNDSSSDSDPEGSSAFAPHAGLAAALWPAALALVALP
mmetsp:Transcript_95845/g.260182  ORF Transcript_95845/g.260182 Transcript_95845/m.260182 type:complete len:315 (-) Transcript_95845:92-1036(-)